MNLRRMRAVTKKEFIHIIRDPRSLGMGIAIPMLLLFLFGYALSLDVDRVMLMVWDQSASHSSRELVSRFSGSRYFTIKGYATSYREIEHAMDHRRALIAIIIPTDYAHRIESGAQATVQVLLDGSDPNTATYALAYARSVAAQYSRDIVLSRIRRTTGTEPALASVDMRPRVWFNDDMVSRNYIFPGLIAVIMMIIAALLTSLTIAREWETGTMEQLISTPITGPELIIGKLVPYFAIGILDLILSILVGVFFFQVPLRGSLVLLILLSTLFLAGALALGMLISISAKNQLLAAQLALVTTMLPAFLLSGLIFPIDNMPTIIQAITHAVTARYYVTILRDIHLKGTGLATMGGEVAFLAIFALLVFAAAIKRFKKKID